MLGEGEHTYEATHDWGQLPPDIEYGNTHGVCIDSQGHVYIHHTVYETSEKADTMVIFDSNGSSSRAGASSSATALTACLFEKKDRTSFSICAISNGAVS